MKKAIILASCALLSTPIFAKGFIEHIRQVKKHKIVHSSKHVDFSGHWVGLCSFEDTNENVTIDLKQTDNKLSVLMSSEHAPDEFNFTQNYTFNTVKLESNSAPNHVENVMSYAEWEDENTVSLEFHSNSFSSDGTEDTYTDRRMTWSMFSMVLDGDKLRVFIPLEDNDDISSCVFHKEG